MVSGLILAAGQSKRTSGARPLLLHETAALIDVVVGHLRESKLDELILVLGQDARRMIQKLSLNSLKVVINPTPSLGISAALQRGLAHLSPRSDAILIAMADMPLVTGAIVNQLVDAYAGGKKGIVVPVNGKSRGYPMILDRETYFEELLTLRGGVGLDVILDNSPKDILEVKMKSDEVTVSVDSHEELEAVKDRIDLPLMAYTFA